MSSEEDQVSPNHHQTESIGKSNEDPLSSNDSPSSSSQKQGSQTSSPHRPPSQAENQKILSMNTGVKNHHSSIETLHEDLKKEGNVGHNAILSPTFGEDDFNAVITDPVLSVLPGKKGNLNKIDMLLEEHKKRKALQNFYEFQNDEDSPSPVSVKVKTPKTAEKPAVGFSQADQELLLSPIETKSMVQESISALHSSAIHSFRFENGKQVSSPEEQYQFQPSPTAQDNDGVFSPGGQTGTHEETGRFKGSARSIEFNDKNISADLKEKYQLSSSKFANTRDRSTSLKNNDRKDYKRTDSNISRNTASSIAKSNTSMTLPQSDTNVYVPKISKNSKKIYQNSQRAKEDELLLQKLMKDQLRRLSSGVTQEAPEEQEEVPEKPEKSESSSPKHKFMRLPSGSSPISEKDQSKISINFTTEEKKARSLYPKSTFSENSSIIKERETTAAQNTSFAPSILSSMGSSSKKKIAAQNQNQTQSTDYTASPRNVKGTTVVEHKRPSRLDNYLASYRKKTGTSSSHTSPTVKEIKEMANASKSIYLRMTKKNIKEVVSASPKRSGKNSSPKATRKQTSESVDVMDSKLVQKCAENNKRPTVNRLGPEEVEKYDEVQRLDIMLYNLRQIQRSNLMSDLYTFRVNNPKPPANIVYKIKNDWNEYADDINEVASERRWFRKMEVEERDARNARPPSPRPMEKIDMSVDSLVGSTQMRQKLLSSEEERANLKSWNDSGLYDRSLMWLAVRDYKVDQLVQAKSEEEMRNCSFRPQISSPGHNSFLGSHNRSQTETPASFLNSVSDRVGKEGNSGLMGLPTNQSVHRTDKSLYQERKSLENYSEIFDLKKAYNLYKISRDQGLPNFIVQE